MCLYNHGRPVEEAAICTAKVTWPTEWAKKLASLLMYMSIPPLGDGSRAEIIVQTMGLSPLIIFIVQSKP